jgi:hypothetical protein
MRALFVMVVTQAIWSFGGTQVHGRDACTTIVLGGWWRKSMHADHVEFSWDASRSSWLLRIEAGEEVIRRHCALPKGADEQTLRTAIEKAVAEEGYELDPASLVHR